MYVMVSIVSDGVGFMVLAVGVVNVMAIWSVVQDVSVMYV